jgi:hypothetical protein
MDSLLQYIPKTILDRTYNNPTINFHTDADSFVINQPVRHNKTFNIIRKFLKHYDVQLKDIYVTIETDIKTYRNSSKLTHYVFSFEYNNQNFVIVIYRYGYSGWLQSVKLVTGDITVSLFELVNRSYKYFLLRGKISYLKITSMLY